MKTNCILIAAISLLVSCKEKPAQTQTVSTAQPSAALSAVLAATPSEKAKAITEARSSAKPGDSITLSGKIMGSVEPFVKGRAAFILADPAVLTACNEHPDDHCSTPWDNCCDSKEDKKRATATIQIVDADGRVLKESVEGVGGLEKLAAITVTGQVAESSSPEMLIVNATAIRAESSGKKP